MKQHSDEANCAWSDYRKDYGVSNHEPIRSREHKAFQAGWDAAKADIRQTHYLVKLADLPEVETSGGESFHWSDAGSAISTKATTESAWAKARGAIALALHLEARESEAAVLARRRDELVQRYSPSQLGYDDIHYTERRIVDHALEAEDRAAAAEAEVARLKGERG